MLRSSGSVKDRITRTAQNASTSVMVLNMTDGNVGFHLPGSKSSLLNLPISDEMMRLCFSFGDSYAPSVKTSFVMFFRSRPYSCPGKYNVGWSSAPSDEPKSKR